MVYYFETHQLKTVIANISTNGSTQCRSIAYHKMTLYIIYIKIVMANSNPNDDHKEETIEGSHLKRVLKFESL